MFWILFVHAQIIPAPRSLLFSSTQTLQYQHISAQAVVQSKKNLYLKVKEK